MPVVGGTVKVARDSDFSNTMVVDGEAIVGFEEIKRLFDVQLGNGADKEELATLLKSAERYCVCIAHDQQRAKASFNTRQRQYDN